MPAVNRLNILLCLFAIVFIHQAQAATVALQSPTTNSSNFSANLGEEFEVGLFVHPQGQSITGVSIYLSFDDQFLELIDSDVASDGVQPVGRGPAVPEGWTTFENDTHGDPGNRFQNFQIDFAQGLFLGFEPALRNPGVVGIIRFRALRTINSTRITFDNVSPISRVTEVRIGPTIVTAFATTTPATISVVGGPVILEAFPETIKFLVGTIDRSLDLDDHVQDVNDSPARLQWTATGNRNITVSIDPASHIVTFGAAAGAFGRETVVFTVVDPQGNVSSESIEVHVIAAPVITFSRPFRLRVDRASELDLNEFVTDADDPALSGIQWEISQQTEFANFRLAGNRLSVGGQTPVRTSIVLTATDADGNRDTAELAIEIAPTTDGPAVDFSSLEEVIATNDGLMMLPPELDLDNFVFDFDFAPEALTWTTEGSGSVIADIDPVTHQVTLRSDSGRTGTEVVTFVATNPVEQSGSGTISVMLIEPNAPPIIAEIPPITIDFGDEQRVDLKEFVRDLDSRPDQIRWEFSGNERIQISIDNNGIATIGAEAIASEEVTFTAIDPQSNRTDTQVLIRVRAPASPEIRDLPAEIQVRHGEVTEGFDLDDFVTDATTPVEAIEWTARGFDTTHLEVKIEPDHRVLFTALPDWRSGVENVIFTATNRAGLSAIGRTTLTTLFPPFVSLNGSITIEEGTTDESLDLDEHVEDSDTSIEAITWEASGFTRINVAIDPETHIVTIDAPQGSAGSHVITFRATDPDGNRGEGTYTVRVIREGEPAKKPPVVAGIPNV